MIKFVEAKRNYLIAIAILFVVISLSNTTYSLFLNTDSTETFNYNTGNLDLEFTEDTQLTLESAFPMSDSEGVNLTPYTLTIKNTGTLTYLFDLKLTTDNPENSIDSKYIKVKVNDRLPQILYTTANIIETNVILYPDEAKTFKINIWLDSDTPNDELGKSFNAKVVTTGTSIYKTLDNSGANPPKLQENMLPIYYDETTKTWKKADDSNTIENYLWYDYSKSLWANSAVISNTSKQIYDITGNNNITIDSVSTNNGNIIIENEYLDLGVKLNSNKVTNIFRIKFNFIESDKLYIISNDKISYYYDPTIKKFVFENGIKSVTSNEVTINKNEWYIIGFTYDTSLVTFYQNGNVINTTNISGSMIGNETLKLGTDKSFKKTTDITIGDIYIYNEILSSETINTNYNNQINVVYDNLIAGYDEFTPMTLYEYYSSKDYGTPIQNKDIDSYFVWIPRFKYKLWNATGAKENDTNIFEKGIEIEFENGTNTSGVIYCEKNTCYSDSLKITRITSNDNGKYYTHPSFKNGDKDITGYWISKYEISTNNINCNNENNTNCTSTNYIPLSKTNNYVWKNNTLTNYYQAVKRQNDNYSIIKNTEWGAITYLTYSKFGICQNETCEKQLANNTFISGREEKDSTTLNPTGIYDMLGSAYEYTLSTYITEEEKLTLNDNIFGITINNNEYDEYYPKGFILGDATKEISANNQLSFIDETNNIFVRGGIANQENQTISNYSASINQSNNYITTRISIR